MSTEPVDTAALRTEAVLHYSPPAAFTIHELCEEVDRLTATLDRVWDLADEAIGLADDHIDHESEPHCSDELSDLRVRLAAVTASATP